MKIFGSFGKKELKEEIIPMAWWVDEKGKIVGGRDIIMGKVRYDVPEDDLALAKKRLRLPGGKYLQVRHA